MTSLFKLTFQKKNIGLGKRKKSIARVFMVPGKGNLIINKIDGNKYFQYNEAYLNNIWVPLETLNLKTQFDIIAFVNGGGLTGQSQAIQLGLARLLCQNNPEHRKTLKSLRLLTRDSRIKERKKYGLRKARKAPQYSKR